MNKIPTLFVRDPDNRARVLDRVNPGCEWVINGEGTATRKYDGTCVMLSVFGVWSARREVGPGKDRPAGFVFVSADPITGKEVGWEPINQSFFAKYHAEALPRASRFQFPPGTYELCGPKINGNPEGFIGHWLVAHDEAAVLVVPRDYAGIMTYLVGNDIEGIVWHHPDGRMCKIKKRDFGLTR